MQKEKVIYFFYNRLQDPLLQSNIFLYINALAEEKLYDVAIITYEDKKYPLSAEEIISIKEKFALAGIKWYPLKWHVGSNIFPKLIDLMLGFFKVFFLAKIKGYKNIVSLGSIAGSYVYLFSKFIKLNVYLYQYEPHSEYAADSKLWSTDGLQFKLLNSFEKKSALHCKVISSGTTAMQNRLIGWNINAKFFKITSVANTELFVFSEKKRNDFRQAHNIGLSKKLIIYPGKIGGLYIEASTLINIFKILARSNPSFHFLAITSSAEQIKIELKKESEALQESITLLPTINYLDMPAALSASDLGIVGVSRAKSKKFSSNIKVGEYLCCGLPYLVCKDISEDDTVAKEYNVGVVVEDFSDSELEKARDEVQKLVSEPKELIAQRCRKAGIEYRGFEKQFVEYRKALNYLTQH